HPFELFYFAVKLRVIQLAIPVSYPEFDGWRKQGPSDISLLVKIKTMIEKPPFDLDKIRRRQKVSVYEEVRFFAKRIVDVKFYINILSVPSLFRCYHHDAISGACAPYSRGRCVLEDGDTFNIVGIDGVQIALVRKIIQHDQWRIIRLNGTLPSYKELRLAIRPFIKKDSVAHVLQPAQQIWAYPPVQRLSVQKLKSSGRSLF